MDSVLQLVRVWRKCHDSSLKLLRIVKNKQTNKLKIKFLKLKAKIIFEQKKKKITRSTTSNHRCKSSASVYSLYGKFYNFSKSAWSESRPFLSVVFIRVMLRSSVSLVASSCLVFLSTFTTNEICRLNLW